MLITVYFWVTAAISTILTTVICIILYPIMEEKNYARMYEIIISTLMLKFMTIPGFWSFKITNPNNINFNDRFIYVPNHASFIDTLLMAQIPSTKKFIMNSVFTKVPLFGQLCLSAGHVPVNKSDPTSIKTTLDRSVKAMEDGSSFVIYAEGTRSPDPYKLLPFKTGAFRLSKQSGVPILPIVIKGTGVGMPIGGMCYKADLEIIIGSPIYVDNIEEGIKSTRSFIEKYL